MVSQMHYDYNLIVKLAWPGMTLLGAVVAASAHLQLRPLGPLDTGIAALVGATAGFLIVRCHPLVVPLGPLGLLDAVLQRKRMAEDVEKWRAYAKEEAELMDYFKHEEPADGTDTKRVTQLVVYDEAYEETAANFFDRPRHKHTPLTIEHIEWPNRKVQREELEERPDAQNNPK